MPRRKYAPCGTVSGYSRHIKSGEAPCAPCRNARSTYDRERYLTRRPEARADERVRRRALAALARLHPDDYQRCYRSAFVESLTEGNPS